MLFRSVLCQIALLSSGAVATIARVTVLSALQSVVFVVVGASQGLLALGFAMIVAAAVSAILWLRAIATHIDLPLPKLLRALRRSMSVALLAGIGPAISFWVYGPYPEEFVMPIVLGGAGGLAGLLGGIRIFRHPLQEELVGAWSKIRHQKA